MVSKRDVMANESLGIGFPGRHPDQLLQGKSAATERSWCRFCMVVCVSVDLLTCVASPGSRPVGTMGGRCSRTHTVAVGRGGDP